MNNETMKFYADNSESYAARSRVSPKLDSFLDLLPANGLILELGTGSGRDAKAMSERGFRVDATDGSQEQAEQASLHLGQPVRQMLFDQLDAKDTYDGVYAAASLLHATPEELPDIILRIYRAMKPDAWVWASFKDGAAPGYDRYGRFYNYMQPNALSAVWQSSSRWQQFRIDSWQGGAYGNEPTLWHAVITQR